MGQSQPVSILMPLSQFFPGGQTTHVVTLAKYLNRVGHRVTLLHTQPFGKMQLGVAPYRNALAAAGVDFVSGDQAESGGILHPFRWDIVHAHSTHDWAFAHSAAGTAGRPYVLTVHGLGCDHPRYRQWLREAAKIIAVGRRVAASLEGLGDVAVIENAVDLEVFRPEPRFETPTIVYLGRLDKSKLPGLRALLSGVRLASRFVPIALQVLSTRPDARTRAMGGRSAAFVGWTDRPELWVNRAHITVGTGRVIREGMAAGTACLVLGERYGGPVEVDTLGAEGPHDFSGQGEGCREPLPEEIARDIIRLVRLDPGERAHQAGKMRAYAERSFSPVIFAQRTADLYAQALGCPRSGAGQAPDGAPAPRPPAASQ